MRRLSPAVRRALAALLLGPLLLALVYQIPVEHTVDIGGYDAAYTQGFYDPESASMPGERPYLAGSDGRARWTGAEAHLLFPQVGLPALVTLRARGRPQPAPPTELTLLLNGAAPLGRMRLGPDWQEQTFAIEGGLLKPEDVVITLRAAPAPLSDGDQRPVGALLDRATLRSAGPPLTPYPGQLLYAALASGLLALLLGTTKDEGTADQRPTTDDQRPRRDRPTTNDQRPHPLFSALRSLFYGSRFSVLGSPLVVAALFQALYRSQPLYPYPLRGLLPLLCLALAALLALRHAPALARRAPALADAAALGGIAAWTAAVLWRAQAHIVQSLPGVENDFRVFALRSARLWGQFPAGTRNADLDGVLRADGFYNQGYPLLLWLVRPLTQDNPFLAARLIAALSGALLLAAAWWTARRLLGRSWAPLVPLALGLSPMVVQYALYLGTDMPFAALCALALALLLSPTDDQGSSLPDEGRRTKDEDSSAALPLALAGLVAGAAFLVRHPGILLLPLGWLAIWLGRPTTDDQRLNDAGRFGGSAAPPRKQIPHSLARFRMMRALGRAPRGLWVFTAAFGLAVLPQVAVNLAQTGEPLYNRQVENVWLAVYGGGNWQRSGEVPTDLTLAGLALADPARFAGNWLANLRGYFGAGGEDTSEFGRAIQLRLLGFPANWLALAGLLGWALGRQKVKGKRQHATAPLPERAHEQAGGADHLHAPSLQRSIAPSLLLAWLALYVASVTVGLALDRFFVVLAPVYALAAVWAARRLAALAPALGPLLLGLALAALLWGGFATGAGYVLDHQQPDEAAIVRLVQTTLRPGERVAVRVPPRVGLGKYSAIAHLAVPAPDPLDRDALRANGASYLLWSSALGQPPLVGTPVGSSGPYTLYELRIEN